MQYQIEIVNTKFGRQKGGQLATVFGSCLTAMELKQNKNRVFPRDVYPLYLSL